MGPRIRWANKSLAGRKPTVPVFWKTCSGHDPAGIIEDAGHDREGGPTNFLLPTAHTQNTHSIRNAPCHLPIT